MVNEPKPSDARELEVVSEPPVVAPDFGEPQALGATPESQLDEPRFLHPSSVIFEALSQVRQFIVPAIFGVYSAAQGGSWGIGFAVLLFSASLLFTLVRYFTLRYRVHAGDFIVTEGLLFRRVRSVPIRRIQNMDLTQNVLHRIFGVAEVRIETASGSKPEATLRVLTRPQIEELREAILGSSRVALAVSDQPVDSLPNLDSPPPNLTSEGNPAARRSGDSAPLLRPTGPGTLVHRIPLAQVLQAGLASNRGTVLLGVLAGFFFQDDWWRTSNFNFLPESVRETFAEQPKWQTLFLFGLGAFAVLFVILRLVSVTWYLLRFYNHRIERVGQDFRVSCGLFTKVSATVPSRRIQFISVHRSLIMRAFGLAAIRIETAGGAGQGNEDAATTVSRRWFLPAVRESEVQRILSELRPTVDWSLRDADWQGVSPLTGRRLLRLAAIACLVISLVGLAVTRPWGWLAGIVAFPIFSWLAIKKSKAKRFAQLDWGVAYQSGLFVKKMSFAFFNRFQTLQISASPFDKRWHMATLSIDTAAAGPAEHVVEVDYLDSAFAQAQFVQLQAAAAKHQPEWS